MFKQTLVLLSAVATVLSLAVFVPRQARAQTMLGVAGGGEINANPGAVYTVDQGTGALSMLGTPYGGVGLPGVATSSTGRVFAVTSVTNPDSTSHLIEIDPVTGALINDIGPMWDASGNGCGIGDLSFQPGTDVLFGLAGNQSSVGTRCGVGGATGGYLMTIDTSTGQYTIIGRDPSFGNNNGGLAFAPDGTLYFVNGWFDPGVLYTLDPATGNILSSRGLSDKSLLVQGLAARPSDGLLFGSYSDGEIYTIDSATGTTTLIGTNSEFIHDLTFLGQPGEPIPALNGWGKVVAVVLLAGLAVAILRRRLA